jgi:hypothetical protein
VFEGDHLIPPTHGGPDAVRWMAIGRIEGDSAMLA